MSFKLFPSFDFLDSLATADKFMHCRVLQYFVIEKVTQDDCSVQLVLCHLLDKESLADLLQPTHIVLVRQVH